MSFKEIKELRQVGKLDEALQMANQALETEPENIWNKRAAAWVYYDFLKQYAQLEFYELFKEYLIKIKELRLPQDENMVFDNCAYQIGKLVSKLTTANFKSSSAEISLVDLLGGIQKKKTEIFQIISHFAFSKPSAGYSFIYKAFHKEYEKWSDYKQFAEWWDFKNFTNEDYLPEVYNGRKLMAIVEQAYVAYAKTLCESKNDVKYDVERFLPELHKLNEKHPEYNYPAYYEAKLLLQLGDKENTLSAFLPFAKQKKNDFWVWGLMAEIFQNDKELHFACFCKALSLKTQEDFLIKIREQFAAILIDRKMYNEAKFEINLVAKTRLAQGWRVTEALNNWMNQEWYKTAVEPKTNHELYIKYISQAEDILIKDIQEEFIAVEFINHDKGILNFIKDKNKNGFFKYTGYINNPKIGDVYAVKFDSKSQDKFYKILSAKKTNSDVKCEAIKDFKGSIRMNPSSGFGFVDDVYIDEKSLKEKSIINSQTIQGKAIMSFNKKKNEWGWKSFQISDSDIFYSTENSKYKP